MKRRHLLGAAALAAGAGVRAQPASFGAAVALIGCRAGLTTSGGAQGVGRNATRAVVISAVMILVLDAFWAVVWLTGRTLR